ncbi:MULTISPECIES: terminase [unclassified Arthrobacter]|uniref:terminase n=1 Tax=unclassified Arthrobacter TaxID=235627 RepID=UPI0011AFD732|nr:MULTISPECIES: terminase [unclassified Arthrobacter]
MPDGSPWVFTDEQARLTLWLFGLSNDGEFTYRQAVYQALKGAGKDPYAAVLSIVHLIGPCKFSHWDDNGDPVATDDPAAWVQIAAVSRDQTKNTMALIPSLLPERTRKAFGNVDVQKEVVYAYAGNRRLEVISSSSRSLEGNRPTFLVAGETQHWIPSRGGIDLYETATYNVLKTGGRFICITNAYEPGEDSVAQRIREAQEKVWAGQHEASGWLYCSREAHPSSPLTSDWAPFILEIIRGDAVWLPIANIVKSMQDGSIPATRVRRMFYNQITAASDSLLGPDEWSDAECETPTYGTKADLSPGDEITLGFDGGKTDDATALVAMRLRDKLLVPLAIWQRPDGAAGDGWHINEAEVDSEVHLAFSSYKVRAFYADVALWESYIANWSEAYREILLIKASPQSATAFDMRGNQQKIARGVEAFVQAIIDKRIRHNRDKTLRIHVLNAKRRRNRFGLTFAKENAESPRKVDGLAAALLAFMAMNDLIESGKQPARQYRRQLTQI